MKAGEEHVLSADWVAEKAVEAMDLLRPYLLRTPLVPARPDLAPRHGPLLLKCEHRQHTGSFKLRGALNKALQLPREKLDEGIIVASTGNHGRAAAYACRLLGGRCTVVVPRNANVTKVKAIRELGASVREHGDDGVESELFARSWAASEGLAYISPYNDPDVVVGQATVGRELVEHVDKDCSVYIAVGGGGLISGVASVLKTAHPGIRIVGCSPDKSPVMDASVRAGHIVDLPFQKTLSDGTAGGIEPDAITFSLCRDLVDRWIRVSEDDIAAAMRRLVSKERLMVEGSAAMTVAAAASDDEHRSGRRIAVLCGGNVDRQTIEKILAT